ncbi:MAG TPA: hypothetical protein VEC11_15120 [Allosphingosinicella sp.]|nr:hypothetical protein [Allosphingosinicella sp.]
MDEEPDWAADDPEIAALLNFTPVVRKTVRHDGWHPHIQRGFIAWLAVRGKVPVAARAVGKRESGAWSLRNSDEPGEFTAAWDRALALYHMRRVAADPPPLLRAPVRPDPPRPEPRHPRELREARARQAANEPDLDEAEKNGLLDEIFRRYLIKLQAERISRLEGRIVEADYYVRQLTFIELILDIGGRTRELLAALSPKGVDLLQVSATPGSVLLEKRRRALWQERGEADRPPPAPLGRHNERFATGRDDYDPERDGDRKEWERRREEQRRLAAEAQREWEDRARREAGAPGNDNDPDPAP